ncbi:MAG: hypothetical protein H7256_14680 [Bdellovibrio sp.]|nr:hypothetical protein [Bdellovibrio sp.]
MSQPEILNNLLWIEELLPTDVIQKSMHGGVGYYLDEKLVLILVESSFTYEHKGITYPYKIWNGCLFPIVRIKQNAVFAKFPFLENHPASPNWLYLPADTENFDEDVRLILRDIKKRNPLFGIMVEIAKPKKKADSVSDDIQFNTSRPSLFAEKPMASKTKSKPVIKPAPKSLKKVKANKKQTNNLLLSVLKRKNTLS